MEVLYPCCCGIDVHEAFVEVCLSRVEHGHRQKEQRRFSTYTADLFALRDWLCAQGCSHVAMESTGIYWRPVYDRLFGYVEITVANAQHMKAVPGRKTDVRDAEWIADLLQHGLLTDSFVPPPEQQALRDLTRVRIHLVQERARLLNRVHQVLEEATIKVSNVLSDVMGVSGKAILHALASGESDPCHLANLAHPSLLRKREQLIQALQGEMRPHQQFLLQELLHLIETIDHSLLQVEEHIEECIHPFEAHIQRLEQITGVSRRIIYVLFAEVGTDMRRFCDAAHLASWAGMCPGQHETGGKRKSGRLRKGNRYLRVALIQAGHATGHTQTYLGEQYRQIGKRRGRKRAAVAVGHSILTIYYHMMASGASYQEKGVEYLQVLKHQHLKQRLIQRIERMGYQVVERPVVSAS
jgi:transposase